MRHQHLSKLMVGMALAILLVVPVGAVGFSGKVFVDGYQSHAVRTHLRVAHYRWRVGDLRGALEAFRQAGSTVAPAGLRWQMAQLYFGLARNEYAQSERLQAERFCQAALKALDFGRFDHTHNGGTSMTASRCAYLRPAN